MSVQASLSQGAGDKPPIPPRRRGLWGMASALTERAASWTADSDKDKDKGKMQPVPEKETERKPERKLPPPPPHHPRLPSTDLTNAKPTPPPLPKRSEVRKNTRSDSVPIKSAPETDGTAEATAPSQPEAQGNNSSTSTTGSPEIPNDSFSTPPEEISNPNSPPQAEAVQMANPALIPLPDSRPPTPAMSVTKLPPQDAAAKVIAPESNSPTPSRTSSPAPPPPLPRRAAARKSRSMSIIGGGQGRSRPVTPTPAPPIEEEETPDSDKPAEAASHVEVSVPTTELKEKDEESDSPATEIVTASPTTTPPSLPVEGEEKAPNPDAPVTNGIVAKDNGDVSQVVETKKVHINGDTLKDEDKKAVVVNGTGTKRSSINGDSAQEEKEEQVPQEVYIGDATWEERTWKELVKLREDMFWARIGGLRD